MQVVAVPSVVGALEGVEEFGQHWFSALACAEFDHQAGRRAIDLTGPGGGVEVDVDSDSDQGVLGLVAPPLGLDQDAAELACFDLNVVWPLDVRVQGTGGGDCVAGRDGCDDAQAFDLVGAGADDEGGVDALARG